MSARSAISSIEAAWKPRSANSSPATSSICCSRTARGMSRVPARRFPDLAMPEAYCRVGSADADACTFACDIDWRYIALSHLRRPREGRFIVLAASTLLAAATPLAGSEPAGGAALGQVAVASAMAVAVTTLLLWLCAGHRSGAVRWLGVAADLGHRLSGLPRWTALPLGLGGAALHVALLGMYWDISLHIDQGRDPGPLANPAHYLILAGLFGIFAAGVIAIALPRAGERPGPRPLRIGAGWDAPIGGVLMAACGAFALTGFPLDDVWHRLFGQDVTLWGPTHLMLIGGAGMSLIGMAVLLGEGLQTAAPAHGGAVSARRGLVVLLRRLRLMGGLLIGLSTFQGEFDF